MIEVLSSGMFRQLSMELHGRFLTFGTVVCRSIRMNTTSPVLTEIGIRPVGCHHVCRVAEQRGRSISGRVHYALSPSHVAITSEMCHGDELLRSWQVRTPEPTEVGGKCLRVLQEGRSRVCHVVYLSSRLPLVHSTDGPSVPPF